MRKKEKNQREDRRLFVKWQHTSNNSKRKALKEVIFIVITLMISLIGLYVYRSWS